MNRFMDTLKRIWQFLKKSWFIMMIIVVLLVFFLSEQGGAGRIVAIVILALTIIGLTLQIILSQLQLRNFRTYLESNKRIDDISIARSLQSELVTVRRQLHDLMKDEKSPGMIILVKNTYLYYNSKMVKKFTEIYEGAENFNDKVYKLLLKQSELYKNEVQAIRKRLEEMLNVEKEDEK